MGSIGDIPDVDSASAAGLQNLHLGNATQTADDSATPELDDIPDMDDDDAGGEGVVEADDPAALPPQANEIPASSSDNLLSVRTYDCYITYDKYYQTPRMFLSAYDEHKRPLNPKLIFQDISADYAQKTVTIEPFPGLSGVSMASVHPCKHANVMKRFIERINASIIDAQRKAAGLDPNTPAEKKSKGWIASAAKKVSGSKKEREPSSDDEIEGLRVDQYLIVFLKFMSSSECRTVDLS